MVTASKVTYENLGLSLAVKYVRHFRFFVLAINL